MENNKVYDIETIKGYFLFIAYHIETGKWHIFSINQYRNDIYSLIRYLENNKSATWIGFNNLGFDGQVVEFIYRNYNEWHELSGIQVAAIISEFASNLIDDMNHGVFSPYREWELAFRQMDVFKIQHFDNKNRMGNNPGMVGLKRLEYEMDMEDIEGMPTLVDKEDFIEEECEELVHYCKNDVWATYKNYKYLIGETDNPIYRGTNQIRLREALSKKFGFNATNWSNSKYGDEIIKTLYCREARIQYSELPKKGTFRKEIKLKNCTPDYIEFQTDQLKDFLQDTKKKKLTMEDKFETSVSFDKQIYTFAKGGLHNVIDNKQYHSDERYRIIDVDVTSYYVATILNNQICPAHLDKKAFMTAYQWIYDERTRLKPLSKTDDDIKGIVAGYKEAGVSVYGKMGDYTSWLFDSQGMLTTCIAGQFSIMMLIEAQTLIGNKCIMANTDGATFLVERGKEAEFYAICDEWKLKTRYKLEYFNFLSMWFSNVNHYIALYDDYEDPIMGKVKRKGHFLTFSELHKNKSNRVIALAMYEYFINKRDIEEFINQFDDIYQFCARSSAGEKYYHTTREKDDTEIRLPKLIRYYPAKSGIDITKTVKDGNLTNAKSNKIQPKEYPKMICNSLPPSTHEFHLGNVDRSFYIQKAKEIVYSIEKGKPANIVKPNPSQLDLFA